MKKRAIGICLVVVALLAAGAVYVVQRQMADRRLARSVIGRWESARTDPAGTRHVGTWRFNRDGTGVLEAEVLSATGESVNRFLDRVLWKVRGGKLHITAPGTDTQVAAIRCTPDTLDVRLEMADVQWPPVFSQFLARVTFERVVPQAGDT